MEKKKTVVPNPFQTMGIDVFNANFAPQNKFNAHVFNRASNGTLVDFIGHLPESSRCVSVRNLDAVNGKSPRYDLKMAYSVQEELAVTNIIRLPHDFYKKHTDFLIGTYVLVGLGYCSVKCRDKMSSRASLCTKNPAVIQALCRRYNLPLPTREMHKYMDRWTVTKEETEKNVLHCVRIVIEDDRVTLKAATIYPRSKLTTLLPMFDIGFYSDSICKMLTKGVFEIRFAFGSNYYAITTSLNKKTLAVKFGIDSKYAENLFYTTDDMGVISVYDFKSGEFTPIRLIDITSIHKLA